MHRHIIAACCLFALLSACRSGGDDAPGRAAPLVDGIAVRPLPAPDLHRPGAYRLWRDRWEELPFETTRARPDCARLRWSIAPCQHGMPEDGMLLEGRISPAEVLDRLCAATGASWAQEGWTIRVWRREAPERARGHLQMLSDAGAAPEARAAAARALGRDPAARTTIEALRALLIAACEDAGPAAAAAAEALAAADAVDGDAAGAPAGFANLDERRNGIPDACYAALTADRALVRRLGAERIARWRPPHDRSPDESLAAWMAVPAWRHAWWSDRQWELAAIDLELLDHPRIDEFHRRVRPQIDWQPTAVLAACRRGAPLPPGWERRIAEDRSWAATVGVACAPDAIARAWAADERIRQAAMGLVDLLAVPDIAADPRRWIAAIGTQRDGGAGALAVAQHGDDPEAIASLVDWRLPAASASALQLCQLDRIPAGRQEANRSAIATRLIPAMAASRDPALRERIRSLAAATAAVVRMPALLPYADDATLWTIVGMDASVADGAAHLLAQRSERAPDILARIDAGIRDDRWPTGILEAFLHLPRSREADATLRRLALMPAPRSRRCLVALSALSRTRLDAELEAVWLDAHRTEASGQWRNAALTALGRGSSTASRDLLIAVLDADGSADGASAGAAAWAGLRERQDEPGVADAMLRSLSRTQSPQRASRVRDLPIASHARVEALIGLLRANDRPADLELRAAILGRLWAWCCAAERSAEDDAQLHAIGALLESDDPALGAAGLHLPDPDIAMRPSIRGLFMRIAAAPSSPLRRQAILALGTPWSARDGSLADADRDALERTLIAGWLDADPRIADAAFAIWLSGHATTQERRASAARRLLSDPPPVPPDWPIAARSQLLGMFAVDSPDRLALRTALAARLDAAMAARH